MTNTDPNVQIQRFPILSTINLIANIIKISIVDNRLLCVPIKRKKKLEFHSWNSYAFATPCQTPVKKKKYPALVVLKLVTQLA